MSKSTHLSGFDEDDDDEGPKYKEIFSHYLKVRIMDVTDLMPMQSPMKCLLPIQETLKVMCIWDCCELWIRISEVMAYLVFDPFTELTITLCIVVNVVFMALDHYSIDYDENGGM